MGKKEVDPSQKTVLASNRGRDLELSYARSSNEGRTSLKGLPDLKNIGQAAPLSVTEGYVALTSPQIIGLLVRDARVAMALSQQSFADLAGVGRRFLSELENGKSTLEFGKVLQVCKAAGIDLFAKRR